MNATELESAPLTVIIADGLDASEDGRGWGKAHQKAAMLANAAPDMLKALKGAQSALRKALPFLPPDDEAHFIGEWLDEINEAIAKAEGNQ